MNNANNINHESSSLFDGFLTKADILKELPPVDETLVGLPRKEIGVLIAAGATGKSFFVLNLLLASCNLTKNHLIVKKDDKNLKILYVSLEDRLDDINRRMNSYKEALHLDEKGLNKNDLDFEIICYKGAKRLISKDIPQNENELWLNLNKKVQESRADLVIIDTMIKTYEGYDENSNPDMSKVLSYFNEMAIDKNCSILLLHHTNKGSIHNNSQSQTDSRGASAIVDNSRWVLSLKKNEDDTGIVAQSVKMNFTSSNTCNYKRWCRGSLLMEEEDYVA